MQIYLLGLVVSLLSFCLQIWPRLIKRYFGVDTWRWLLFADYVRKHKALPKESPSQYIVPSVFGYPPVTIFLLSLFPKKFFERYQFIFSPFFDLLNNYLIFIAALIFTHDLKTAIIAQTIAALTPIIAIEASNLNSRMLSSFVFTSSFFPLLLYTLKGDIIYLLIAAAGLYVLFFTHRFAIQAYIVSSIGLTIAQRDPFYLVFFLTIFAFVNIMSPRMYKAILKEHIASLKFWANQIELRFAHQFRGVSKQQKKPVDFIQQVYSLSTKNPLAYIVGNNPWILVFVLFFTASHVEFLSIASMLSSSVQVKLEAWAVSLLVWMILVLSIKKLRIFGEGQRYIEYSMLPMGLVIASYVVPLLSQFGLVVYGFFALVMLLMVVTIVFLQYKAIVKDRARSITSDVWEIIRYINTHNGKDIRLAMFPLQLGDAILYFTKCSILTSDLYSGLSQLNDLFPVLKVPLTTVLKRYTITHIFFDRTYVSLEELKLKTYKILVDRDDFVLLKL